MIYNSPTLWQQCTKWIVAISLYLTSVFWVQDFSQASLQRAKQLQCDVYMKWSTTTIWQASECSKALSRTRLVRGYWSSTLVQHMCNIFIWYLPLEIFFYSNEPHQMPWIEIRKPNLSIKLPLTKYPLAREANYLKSGLMVNSSYWTDLSLVSWLTKSIAKQQKLLDQPSAICQVPHELVQYS